MAAAVIASAAGTAQATGGRPTAIGGDHGHTCTYSKTESSINADGAKLRVTPGSNSFTAQFVPGRMRGVYLTAGFYDSKNSYATPKYGGCNRLADEVTGKPTRAAPMPVLVGRQGTVYGSMTCSVSAGTVYDCGYDIWFHAGHRATTFSQMSTGGTEIMVWLNSDGLGDPRSSVSIDGRHWAVTENTMARGHRWNVINFIAPRHSDGATTVQNLKLNDFISNVIRRGLLPLHDNLMAVDRGVELWNGSAYVYSVLSGLK